MFPNWNWTLIAVSVSFHSVAILSTIFRLWYRWYTARMWWDDGWAVLAFLADIACLVATLIERPVPGQSLPRLFHAGNWIVSFAYPTLMWATRISILAATMRVSYPEGMLRHVAISTGVLFGLMGIASLAFRLGACLTHSCLMMRSLLITQTACDCVADILLSALPIWFLRSMKLRRPHKILICSALSASMVINIVTIMQAVVFLSNALTSGSIIFEHVKVSCSMMVCNLLVIVTFVYRTLYKGKEDIEDSVPTSSRIDLTTVELAQEGLTENTSESRVTRSSAWSFYGGRSRVSASVGTGGVSGVERPEGHQQVGSKPSYAVRVYNDDH